MELTEEAVVAVSYIVCVGVCVCCMWCDVNCVNRGGIFRQGVSYLYFQ